MPPTNVQNPPVPPSPAPTPPPRRKKWLYILLGLIVLLLVILFVAGHSGGPAPVPETDSQVSATTAPSAMPAPGETRYLVFGIPIDGSQVYNPGGDIFGAIDKEVAALASRVGTTGDAKHKLGFMIVLPVWFSDSRMGGDTAQIQKIISHAFAVAKKENVAVYFTLYSMSHASPFITNWYDPQQPGYNPDNKKNVEWTDWSGTPTKNRYSIQEGETRMPPVLCYNSPAVLSEVSYISSKVLGPELVKEVSDLRAGGKENLFGGVTLTEELSLDDYSVIDKLNPKLGTMMTQDGALKTRLGYCALTNAGYSAAKPPTNYPAALALINQQYAAYWGKQLVQAGIPKTKLYTHVAPTSDPAYLQYTNAPIDASFNDYSTPGWTTYLAGPLASGYQMLYKAVAAHGMTRWASTESSPTNITGTTVSPETFLAWHYNHGANLIVMNAADSSSGGQGVGRDMWTSAALAAYKKFLSGGALKE